MIETNNEIIQGHAPTLDKINNEIATLPATIEEIVSTISNVDTKADEGSKLAEQGEESTQEAVQALHDVTEASELVSTEIDELQKS